MQQPPPTSTPHTRSSQIQGNEGGSCSKEGSSYQTPPPLTNVPPLPFNPSLPTPPLLPNPPLLLVPPPMSPTPPSQDSPSPHNRNHADGYAPKPKLKFPIFSRVDVKRWLYRKEQTLDYYSIAKDQKVKVEAMHLEGSPLQWYR